MSDVTTGSTFNPQFFMNPPWWLGRVEKKETWFDNVEGGTFTNVAQIKGWGYRYKVRIFNWHTGDLNELPPEQMAFCQVVMPVTAGSGHGGASVSPSIESGSVVFGFFMDGMAGQEGYIVGVLGNSNNNVPKERGAAAPGPPPEPPNRPIGPGSLSNVTLPSNIDQLSTTQLRKFLNPARTPTSEEFKLASIARSEAKAKGLSPEETERQVLAATVKASRQSSTGAPSLGNCNIGYQQFNDTYSDSNKTPAYVPDNLNVYNIPLSITEGLHVTTLAWETQDQDKKEKRPLRSACKKDDSDLKGIAKVLNNLIQKSSQIQRTAGEISAAASSIQSQMQGIIQSAASFVSSYMSNLLNLALEQLEVLITETLQKKIVPLLLPSEIPIHNNIVSEALELISCLFKKIVSSLLPTFVKLLTDFVRTAASGPICAVESLISDFLGPIIGEISSALSVVLGGIGNIASLVSSAFSFISGILEFFKCDEDQSCPGYDEIDLIGPSGPGIQIGDFSSNILKDLQSGGSGRSSCSTDPVFSGPPKVKFIGGGGSGASANPIITNSSVIGFDIVSPGSYLSTPLVFLEDSSGNGSGGSFQAEMEDDEENPGFLKVKNIIVISPGTGYLNAPDGSRGGSGSVWIDPDEGYIRRSDRTLEVVPVNASVQLNSGDIYYAPDGSSRTITEPETITNVLVPNTFSRIPTGVAPFTEDYPVILTLSEIKVVQEGFGYSEGDEIIITPNNGTVAEPVISPQGKITEVRIIRPGVGFDDIPEIKTNSLTGFNALLVPVFTARRVTGDEFNIPKDAKLVTVIDCVGNFTDV